MITSYINGQFFEKQEAKISIFDLGFLRGYGVFEYFRTYQKKPFHQVDHLERLKHSAETIGLPCDQMFGKIETIVDILIQKNGFEESTIRIILTGGETDDGINAIEKPSLIIITQQVKLPPTHLYEKGAKAITMPANRTISSIKTLNYLNALLARKTAEASGAIEALYLNAPPANLPDC